MLNDKPFDTNSFFVGGAGMFLQYHDIIKPVYLYAIISLIFTDNAYGLPISIIKNMDVNSIFEWYKHRRYVNPLKQLDWAHKSDSDTLDNILSNILQDSTIYRLAPVLNIRPMLSVYKSQQFSFPFFIYSEKEDPNIKTDCDKIFAGLSHRYVYGDLKKCLDKCDQNFTYIFSDIELMKNASEILSGTFSHILLASDYRYNYTDNMKTFKYDLRKLMASHPYIRIGTTRSFDLTVMLNNYVNLFGQGGSS